MQNSEEDNKLDLKGVMKNLVSEEPKEMSQEEAIKAYREKSPVKSKKSSKKNTSDEEDDEDEAHLRRMKQELLASLERVNLLAKKLFGEKEKLTSKEFKEKEKFKAKEKNLEQMKEKMQESKERSRDE